MTDAESDIRTEADEQLFHAIAFADLPGVPSTAKQIAPAVAAGADLNGILKDGQTPLTYAITSGMGSPKAVRILLELGADPSRRDANGWTPWGIAARCLQQSDATVAERMRKIVDLLDQHGASHADEVLLTLEQAMVERNKDLLLELFANGVDVNDRAIRPLELAVETRDAGMVRFILEQGATPDGTDPRRTPLMRAVKVNEVEIIEILLEAGADPTRYSGDPADKVTLIRLALMCGHDDLGEWLQRRFPDMEGGKKKKRRVKSRFQPVVGAGTNGINHDLDNDDIVRTLDRWDKTYGIEISDVGADRVTVRFLSLPESLDALAREIHEFCPDVIDQGFGVLDDLLAMQARDGKEIAPDMARLIEGVDLQHPDAGLILLQRSLRDTQTVALWWD